METSKYLLECNEGLILLTREHFSTLHRNLNSEYNVIDEIKLFAEGVQFKCATKRTPIEGT